MLKTENPKDQNFQSNQVKQNQRKYEISQRTPIKTLDQQKILRDQLNQLYRNLQGSYGEYRNKLVRVMNYTEDEQMENSNQDFDFQQKRYSKANNMNHENRHMRLGLNERERTQTVSDSPAGKYVQSISRKIIQQRKAYREKQRELQSNFLGVQLGMQQYKRDESRQRSKQKNQQRVFEGTNQHHSKNQRIHTQQYNKGMNSNSMLNLSAKSQLGHTHASHSQVQQMKLTLNPNSMYVEDYQHSQRQKGSQQRSNRNYQQNHFQTFRKFNQVQVDYPKFNYEPPSSNRSAFDKYRARQGLRRNTQFVQSQEETVNQINPITMIKNSNSNYNQSQNHYEKQGQDYQNLMAQKSQYKVANENRFKKNMQGDSPNQHYHQRMQYEKQQHQKTHMKPKDYKKYFDTSSQSNYFTITDGQISSQLRVEGNRNRVKFQERLVDDNDGNMSQKLHYRKSNSPHSYYPNIVVHNEERTKKNYLSGSNANKLYDQVRSMTSGYGNVQKNKKEKEYNIFLLNQQKVLEDQKHKSRILIDEAYSVIQDKASPHSNEYYQSFIKKEEHKSVSPVKILEKNLSSNRLQYDSPAVKLKQQVHHHYDSKSYSRSQRHQKHDRFDSFGQKFQETQAIEVYQGYQEPLHDYQHNFQSYLRYFLNEVIDLFTISELLKYHLKHKSYEMLTKLFTFAYPKKNQSSISKVIPVKEIDLKKTIKLIEFQLLVSRMLEDFKKSQIDHICRNIFKDKNEITFDQFRQSLSSGLSDHQAQQLSSTILNLHNMRTSDLMGRLFLTWGELQYFETRIKDLLKAQPQKMQEFTQQITVDNLLNSEMILEYLRQGDQGIKIRNRKLRVDIYLNRIMGKIHKESNFLKWVYEYD